MNPADNNRLSFTTSFHFHNGCAFFDGFTMETVVSNHIGAKYRVLIKHPADGKFWTMKGLEEPMTQTEIGKVLKNLHKGALIGKDFAFEVFDKTGTEKLFATVFNAQDRIPADGFSSDKEVFTTFSWAFELPESMRKE